MAGAAADEPTVMVTERRSYTEVWVIAAILLVVVLLAQLPRAVGGSSDGSARVTSVMGGARRVLAPGVRRTEVTTIMGGSRIDLRQVALQPGEELVINLLTVMGGVTILVPDGWAVDTQAVPVLGGLEDVRVPPEWSQANGAAASADGRPAPRLVLHGAVLMGGVRITS